MNNYYEEIEHLIRKNEINKKVRTLIDNSETLETYWNIGRLIVEAQGGETRAKYGNGLIKEWSEKFTKLYGNGYSLSNMKYFRQFYLYFQKSQSLIGQLTWTHYLHILPIKDEKKRNYYINLCIEHNLSVRELIREIKSNSYERLVKIPEKIEIINHNEVFDIKSNLRNPIIITLNKGENILSEKDLEMKILSELQVFFRQLGSGYALVGNEYKITSNNKNYFIDILLFNVEINCYIVVELKIRELRREDKSQIKFYMDLVDSNIKKQFHNKTIGIIITRRQDKFIATFVSDDNIIPITYLLKGDDHICE